uniref:Uncharacterized protein n=1 Tax=Arundo donax TaxID=35708 RepID=A0A0A8Z3X4_ARUDO
MLSSSFYIRDFKIQK